MDLDWLVYSTFTDSSTHDSLFQGYLGECLCEQCGLSVVGLEKETVRLTAAKRREHFDTHGGDDEDNGETCDPQETSCDNHTHLDSSLYENCEWSSHLSQVLPVDLKWPFHISLELNVNTAHQSAAKLSQLLLHLQSKLHSPISLCCNVQLVFACSS